MIGWKNPQDAIGKDFKYGNQKGHVIGIVNDFNFESMHQQIVPMVLLKFPLEGYYNNISIKLTGNNIPASLAYLEKTWRNILPETPYQFTFLDENFDKLYQKRTTAGNDLYHLCMLLQFSLRVSDYLVFLHLQFHSA